MPHLHRINNVRTDVWANGQRVGHIQGDYGTGFEAIDANGRKLPGIYTSKDEALALLIPGAI